MPIYEYECEECNYHFEELQPFTDKTTMKCPQCGGKAKRLISEGAGLIFKGSGFYITDYARKNSSVSSDSSKENTSTKEKKSVADSSPKVKETKTTTKDE